MLEAEQEVWRHQRRLYRQLNPLLHRLAFALGKRDKLEQRIDLAFGHRTPERAMRELGNDPRHTSLPRCRVAHQNLLPARLFHLRRIRSDELDHVQELVLLIRIGVFVA